MSYIPGGTAVGLPKLHPLHFILNFAERLVAKLWGLEHWIINNDKYCFKVLTIFPGYQCSLHYHNEKDETFVVQSGEVLLEHQGVEELLGPGQKRRIEPGTPHRFKAKDGTAVVIEISTHHDDADVVRIEESKKDELESTELPRTGFDLARCVK